MSNTTNLINHMKKHPIYFDAEFTGLHQYTTLISIGLVSETSYFYAEFNDYSESQLDEWLKSNIINNLAYKEDQINRFDNPDRTYSISMRGLEHSIKKELLAWLENESKLHGKQLQFYGDCLSYDWVLLNNLICKDGLALNLPKFIYYIPIDLCTIMQSSKQDPDETRENLVDITFIDRVLSRPPLNKFPKKSVKHNSLFDAYVIKGIFDEYQNSTEEFQY